MIYLFRKRNGSILAASKESADKTFNSPNNFITHQPEYLGVVDALAFKDISRKAQEDVPIQIEKLVKKDGEDHLITLTAGMIREKIAEGDKVIEAEYETLLRRQKARYDELLEELAETADKSSKPISYSRKIGGVEDAQGDLSGTLKGYVNEQ